MIALTGCRTTHVVTTDCDGRPQFNELTIAYEIVDPAIARLSANTITLADAKERPLRTALVSCASRCVDTATRPKLRLVIHAPHPERGPDSALALLQAPAESEDSWRTVATRTLPRTEVDLLLTQLAGGGLFDSQTRPNSNTRIALEMDGHRFEKSWTREPRLDRLAVETYDAGN